MRVAKAPGLPADSAAPAAPTAAKARIVEAALALFAEHGIGGTSLQRIADAIGVTKAAVYHQYPTKDEIVLAVAEGVLAGLDEAVAAAAAERSRARARETLVARMIELAVEQRRVAGILQRDPVMLRFLQEHGPFRRVMQRVNRTLMGGASDPAARVRAATLAGAIAGAVVHPLVQGLEDEALRSHLRRQLRRLLPGR